MQKGRFEKAAVLHPPPPLITTPSIYRVFNNPPNFPKNKVYNFHESTTLCPRHTKQFKTSNKISTYQGEKYTGAPGDFASKMQERALKNKKSAPENHHRLQCKSLFNVADLVNGMWKVAPQNNFFSPATM